MQTGERLLSVVRLNAVDDDVHVAGVNSEFRCHAAVDVERQVKLWEGIASNFG